MTHTLATSPLLRRIRAAIDSLRTTDICLHVSVADELKWEPSAAGGRVLVRWICWAIERGGSELLAPEFEVVGRDVTVERLREELPSVFVDVLVVVDNDIQV